MKYRILWAAAAMSVLSSCTDSTNSPEPTPQPSAYSIKLGVATSVLSTKKLQAEVYLADSLSTGWNTYEIVLTDPRDGKPVTDVHLKSLPWMTMSSMRHGAPGELISHEEGSNRARLAAVFQMPSGAMGTWVLRIRAHDHRFVGTADSALQNDTLTIPVTIKASSPARVVTFKGPDSVKRVLAWIAPKTPVVGSQDVEFGMWSMDDSVKFTGDSLVGLTFEPTMPTMGHGSSGNIQPVPVRKGHYVGKANLTMSGDWRFGMRVVSGATLLDSTKAFDVRVP